MEPLWLTELAAAAVRAPSADNSQPWVLQWNGSVLDLTFRQRGIKQSVFAAGSHATLLSVGAVMEHLRVALVANGMQPDWRWPSDPAVGLPYVSLPIASTSTTFVRPDALFQRHTNRGPYHSTPLPNDIAYELQKFQDNRTRVVLVVEGSKKAALVRLARYCSEARFCSQPLHEWLIGSLRFTPEAVERGDGLDVDALCLPPGARQFLRFTSDWRRLAFLNRLGVYKLLALSEVALLAAGPALLCVIGRTDARSILDAGILLSRAWTYLNGRGIAVHPYYVVPDQINRAHDGSIAHGFEAKIAAVETELRPLLALQAGESLHMMLRLGYAKTTPVYSRRLPLDSVLINHTAT